MRTFALLLASAVGSVAVAAAAQSEPQRPASRWMPVDKDGWTVLAPSRDSRIIYVSSTSGDDATGAACVPSDPAVGSDPFLPSGAVKPFKTIAKGLSQMRDGFPDWLLLKRGDTWKAVRSREGFKLGVGFPPGNGRSAREPMVFGAYGGHKERPTLRLDWDTPGVYGSYLGFRHLVLTGICFYADTRDPESPTYYVPPGKRVDGHAGILVLLRPESSGENLLVEDCSFRFCMIHIAGRSIRNLVIRRCLYLDSYVPAGGHLMASGGCLIEENVFDHVGWSENPRTHPLGRASMLVHSVYCCDLVGAIFRGNLFLRSSSIGIKLTATAPGSSRDVVVDNNLFVEGEIGISMGGNEYLPYRFVNPLIVNNVMLDLGRARPTGRDLGWGLSIENWDGGLVANNLFAHQASDKVLNAYAIAIRGQGTRNVAVRDNVIHGLKTRSAGIVLGQGDDKAGGIVLKDNLIQFPGRPSPLIRLEGTAAGYQLSGNTYWSGADPNAWFVAGPERKPLSLQAFTQLMQDPKASAREVQFPDPTRTVEAYNAHVGGQATFEDFLAQVRGQSRANWRREYTAGAVNDWVRAGFGMKRRPILYQEAKGTEEERDR